MWVSRATVRVVAIVLAGALIVGIILAAIAPGTRPNPTTTTPLPAETKVTSPLSADPATDVRNACVDWARVGNGSTSGTITPAQVAATLADMAALADAAAVADPVTYSGFANAVHDMAGAFRANDNVQMGKSIPAINTVCSIPH